MHLFLIRERAVSKKRYFDRTKDDSQEQACPGIQRVVNALGISIATVKRVMADFNRGVSFVDQEEVHFTRFKPEIISLVSFLFSFSLVRSDCCVEIHNPAEQAILIFSELLRLRQTFPQFGGLR